MIYPNKNMLDNELLQFYVGSPILHNQKVCNLIALQGSSAIIFDRTAKASKLVPIKEIKLILSNMIPIDKLYDILATLDNSNDLEVHLNHSFGHTNPSKIESTLIVGYEDQKEVLEATTINVDGVIMDVLTKDQVWQVVTTILNIFVDDWGNDIKKEIQLTAKLIARLAKSYFDVFNIIPRVHYHTPYEKIMTVAEIVVNVTNPDLSKLLEENEILKIENIRSKNLMYNVYAGTQLIESDLINRNPVIKLSEKGERVFVVIEGDNTTGRRFYLKYQQDKK